MVTSLAALLQSSPILHAETSRQYKLLEINKAITAPVGMRKGAGFSVMTAERGMRV